MTELRPRSFLFENVAIFGQKRGRKYLSELQERLSSDYLSFPNFYCSSDFGKSPQRTLRIRFGNDTKASNTEIPSRVKPLTCLKKVLRHSSSQRQATCTVSL